MIIHWPKQSTIGEELKCLLNKIINEIASFWKEQHIKVSFYSTNINWHFFSKEKLLVWLETFTKKCYLGDSQS